MGLRFYLVTHSGLRRIPMNIMEKRAAVTSLAATKQKLIQTLFEQKNGQVFFDAQGSYIEFDADGYIRVPQESLDNAFELVDAYMAIEKERSINPKVTNVRLHRRQKELKAISRWNISESEKKAIGADLLGSSRPKGSSSIPLLNSKTPHREAR